MKYRKTRIYKYVAHENETFETGIVGRMYQNDYIMLNNSGSLIVKKGYRWDGSSSIAIDTPSSMSASMCHDAMYQLIREGALSIAHHKFTADEMYRDICLDYGMSKFRAWYQYKAVKKFGKSSCVSDVITVNPV